MILPRDIQGGSRTPIAPAPNPVIKAQAVFAGAYLIVFWLYLWSFTTVETELIHWLTLVALPAGGLVVVSRVAAGRAGISRCMEDVGLSLSHWSRGLWQAAVVGLLLGAVQLLLSRDSTIIIDSISSGRFVYAYPLAVGLMLVTAGFTEEFFFRGVLQSALWRATGSKVAAIVVSGVTFGLYHLPYAYNLESWPSHGDLAAAFGEGVLFTAILGLIFAGMYARYRNLLAPVLLHSMFNAWWAVKMFL